MRRSDQLFFAFVALTAFVTVADAVKPVVAHATRHPIAFAVQCRFGEHAITIRYTSLPGD